MAALSNFLEDALINHALRNVAFASPVTVYLALYSSDPTDADAGTEITGAGYARQAITFGVPANGVSSNSVQISFPEATAAYPAAVTHVGIRTALTVGSLLFHGSLAAPRTIALGDQLIVKVGQLVARLA